MKEEKRIHKGYTEFQLLTQKGQPLKQYFGKYQYIFSSIKGRISCIELKDYFNDGIDLWEIFCLEGKLFKDTQRFSTFEQAKEECKKILDDFESMIQEAANKK